MWQVWGRGEVHTGIWWGNMRERDHLGDLDIDGMIILKLIFSKWDGVAWTKLLWHRNRTGGELL